MGDSIPHWMVGQNMSGTISTRKAGFGQNDFADVIGHE
jgi:hypothetical protein